MPNLNAGGSCFFLPRISRFGPVRDELRVFLPHARRPAASLRGCDRGGIAFARGPLSRLRRIACGANMWWICGGLIGLTGWVARWLGF